MQNGQHLPAPRRVLAVDDDAALLRLLVLDLDELGYEAVTAANGAEALVRCAEERFDAIVLDLEMPVLDGRGFFRALRQNGDRTPVLILSGFGASRARIELGAEGALDKPYLLERLAESLEAVIALGERMRGPLAGGCLDEAGEARAAAG